jgi:lysophospholipase L1-like esterase
MWEQEIEAIEGRHLEIKHADLVFIGSSSIALWDSLKRDFAPYTVVQAGFGGSRIADAITYHDRLINRYHPKIVVLFSGTNDLCGDESTATPAYVAESIAQLMKLVRLENPDTVRIVLPITPTPSRAHVRHLVDEANALIRQYDVREGYTVVDTAASILTEGKPDPTCFVEDQLHLSPLGYKKWVAVLRPIIDELLR